MPQQTSTTTTFHPGGLKTVTYPVYLVIYYNNNQRTMNNINGGGGRKNMMSSVDFYRRVPKDLTEVRTQMHCLCPFSRCGHFYVGFYVENIEDSQHNRSGQLPFSSIT